MGGWAGRARQVGRKVFTLVELVVVVGIIIVMGLVGLPFFTAMMQNSRFKSQANSELGPTPLVSSSRLGSGMSPSQYHIHLSGGDKHARFLQLGPRHADKQPVARFRVARQPEELMTTA